MADIKERKDEQPEEEQGVLPRLSDVGVAVPTFSVGGGLSSGNIGTEPRNIIIRPSSTYTGGTEDRMDLDLNNELGSAGSLILRAQTFTASDTTPSVLNANCWQTAGSDTITDFDDGVIGQIIYIKAASSITIQNNAAIELAGGVDFDMVDDDVLVLKMFDDQVWNEIGRVVAAQSGVTKFGGDGSDGALAVTSGTTSIDINFAASLVKNYTSISITGTGQIDFSNPKSTGSTIILRSQGDVTLTSSADPNIDATGIGAEAGTGGAAATEAAQGSAGNDGTTAEGILDIASHHGVGADNAGNGGAGGVQYDPAGVYARTVVDLAARCMRVTPGSGGGGGQGGSTTQSTSPGSNGEGGNGGRGGGGLIIECGGSLNYTGNIDAFGAAGSDGADFSTGNEAIAGGGGGGGGAGGFVILLYNDLTAASGNIDVSGGAGGAGGDAITASTGGSPTAVPSGGGGGGAGADGGAGGAGADEVTATATGTAGSAAGGRRAGGGGGSGGARQGSVAAGTTSGGAGGAAGANDNVLVAKNDWFT